MKKLGESNYPGKGPNTSGNGATFVRGNPETGASTENWQGTEKKWPMTICVGNGGVRKVKSGGLDGGGELFAAPELIADSKSDSKSDSNRIVNRTVINL